MTRYTRVTVFRNAFGDSTNGGVSSKHTELFVEDPQGQLMKTSPDPRLVFRAEDRGGGYHALVPVLGDENLVGPMFGGNLASAIYGSSKVYRVHDRFETQDDYDALSR